MAEIVLVESSRSSRGRGEASSSSYVPPEPFDSEKLPPTMVSHIRPFLRVANQVELESPRVAYLCRFHAFARAHMLDPISTARGVRQFKTALLQRLEKDDKETFMKRKETSDLRELKCAYLKYEDYIRKHSGDSEEGEREIAYVLSEVLKTVTSEAGCEIVADADGVHIQSEFYKPYNILPLEPGSENQAIMQLPEIKAAIAELRNVRGLPPAESHQKIGVCFDLFDWLQFWFGFQEGNVSNQREHLLLLLASIHARQTQSASESKLGERAVNELKKKLFRNYKTWCKFLGRKTNIWLPSVEQEVRQYKILYMGLYLLIWGESSNLRFMPECLCYIFHHMAYELYGVLSGAVSQITGEKVIPAYGGESESFLKNVVTPIYWVISKEAEKNNSGTADHFAWRNYDDLNEYFWSPDCFQLGWPMCLDHNFFFVESSSNQNVANSKGRRKENALILNSSPDLEETTIETSKPLEETCPSTEREKFVDTVTEDKGQPPQWVGKINFVELRSFWQLFRSFDRMWTFFILALQALMIMAWHGSGSLLHLFDSAVLPDILSIFVTSAVLKLMQALLDLTFAWKARTYMKFLQVIRYVLKPVFATIWTIILSVYYVDSRKNSTCPSKESGSWVGEWCLSSYMVAVGIYLATNAIGMVLFLVPAIHKYIETSNFWACSILSWWVQPRLYVGRGMQENPVSLLKYSVYWVILLFGKLSFSYHFEIKPLVEPTKKIMKISMGRYEWHELFPKVRSNAGAIIAVWTPILLVYFMDTQIWYSVFCTVVGGVYGIFGHLGEIRTMAMLRSRFQEMPLAFNACLVPPASKQKGRNKRNFSKQNFHMLQEPNVLITENEKNGVAKFAQVWNKIIASFRFEDLISNREMDLMTIPMSLQLISVRVQWPVFLLATKFSTALSMAGEYFVKDEHLLRKIKKDKYMYYAVKECYELLKYVLEVLIVGDLEKRVVYEIINEVERSIKESSLLMNFRMSELPTLHSKCIELIDLLFDNKESDQGKVVKVLQDAFEVLTQDMMIHGSSLLDLIYCPNPMEGDATIFLGEVQPPLFVSTMDNPVVRFPLPEEGPLKEQINRLLFLLTAKETALEIPVNLEARRRISYFATSLNMDMPCAPKVRNMLSFSVLTPHCNEEVNFSLRKLNSNQEGVSIIFYMQKLYPDEWKNFLERMECENLEEIKIKGKDEDLRNWASFRGQTLSRTVRGMMYYREALKMQTFLDMAEDKDILEDYNSLENGQTSKFDALADMKFTFVISCQMFGAQKASADSRAQDIIDLMMRYPSLRVAYIEEKEVIGTEKSQKVYFSVLIKAINHLDQEIYRIKLPGPPIIGEGKPENQNHALIFTRGDALQTIDMNQDNYMEEAFKMRNILQEFLRHSQGRHPTLIGLREHIFTGSVSSLAWFMSYQENSFATIGQRLLANPLKVRFHYGHPDLFDRVFHFTRGGISRASKTINLSDDIFAGFNSILRGGCVSYHEYMQVGKGRDVGLNQIAKFEAKVANGNSEQTLSRDVYRLGHRFDFFRMLSFYFTTVGFYFSSLLSVLGVYVFLYGQLYLVLSGMEKALIREARMQNIESFETTLASQLFIQLGLLTGLPMVMEIGLQKGFFAAVMDFFLMQLQLAAVFFTFSLGTKSHYYGRTILHGGAKYIPPSRKVVVFHSSFTENYRLYSRSHFVKGFELMLLLIVYDMFKQSYQTSMTYVLITCSIWFMSITWLFAPFLFNPSGFNWSKVVDDWVDWNKWIKNLGGIGVQQDKSWESWWNDEQAHLRHSGVPARAFEILLSLRFFIYQYGMVYRLDILQEDKNFLVYLISWLVIAVIFLFTKVMKEGRIRLGTNHQLRFRTLKAGVFVGALSTIIMLSKICNLSLMDIIVSCLAFLPTGWGLILIAQAVRPMIEQYQMWEFVQLLAQAYDYGMAIMLFAPVATLAWLPIISAFQTRFLFNEAFSRHLQIQKILAGKVKHR